ncbi:MAG TPA: GDSL-type esterase/lipase family protein [Xanthobacteraceae bacterium]|jgi:hypothetical protein|nr:GDSL-type esterase/lipase family protein [Xanthobacteraceae bacterium]
MKPLVLALAGLMCSALAAFAGDESACSVASALVHADYPLPRVAQAIANKHLTILVVGSASSSLPGLTGAKHAYPARLEATLGKRLGGVEVRVVTSAQPRETAAEMESNLERLVETNKPALVVWQAGTVDAMRGVDQDAFRATLDDGIETIKDNDADVVLLNMQYSPRTESVISMGAYVDVMRFAALQHEIPLFDRLAIMKHWSELGTFDLYGTTRSTDTAERVHDCIGRLLADLVMDGVKLVENDKASGLDGEMQKAKALDKNEPRGTEGR